MRDLWILLFLPLSLAAFHGVKGCLECDPKFTEDVRILLGNLVPLEVPERNKLLERQHKEITHISSKVSHKDKMLRLLAVRNVVKLRVWLKDEFYRLGNETWKGVFIIRGKLLEIRQNLENDLTQILKNFSEVACSEDCIVTEGPVLDCWTCLRMTTRCFRGDYCQDDGRRKAENREISLYLIFTAEAVILASAVLLFHACVTHRRKMKLIRRALKIFLEKKLEQLVEIMYKDDEKKDLEFGESNTQSLPEESSSAESEMKTGT